MPLHNPLDGSRLRSKINGIPTLTLSACGGIPCGRFRLSSSSGTALCSASSASSASLESRWWWVHVNRHILKPIPDGRHVLSQRIHQCAAAAAKVQHAQFASARQERNAASKHLLDTSDYAATRRA